MTIRHLQDISQTLRLPLIFIRHAQSEGQINPSLYKTKGDQHLDLTETGQKQSIAAGKTLKKLFHDASWPKPAITAANATRTRATSQALRDILGTNHVTINPLLDKQNFGLFDGLLTAQELKDTLPDLYEAYRQNLQTDGPLHVRPPQGESIADVIERVSTFLRDISHEKSPIIACTHGMQILCAEKLLTRKSDAWLLEHQDSVPNVALTIFHPNPG